jgi:hypothetical protein
MTPRKPRTEAAQLPPQPKSVPYPPASIWKTKEDGADFEFRGNTFARRGDRVARIFEPAAKVAASPDKAKSSAE